MTSDSKIRRAVRRFNWAKKIAALRYISRLVKLVWQTQKTLTFGIITLRILSAFVPIATLWIGKLIIDTVVAGRSGTPDYYRLVKLVGVEICIVLTGQVVSRASSLCESLLADLFSNRISVRLMEHAATLDLRTFEDPVFYDHLERARRQTGGRVVLITQLLQMCEDTLSLASLSLALLAYSPWLLFLLAVAVLPSFFGETHFARLEYLLRYGLTPGRRKLDYLLY
ncbi:MAG: ABC transporter ATP-binding protein, partial [Blastocatellia bacterium]